MPYRMMGWIHANLARVLHEQRGQGTVEYVGLMLLLATLLSGVVVAAKGLHGSGIAEKIASVLKETIGNVSEKGQVK